MSDEPEDEAPPPATPPKKVAKATKAAPAAPAEDETGEPEPDQDAAWDRLAGIVDTSVRAVLADELPKAVKAALTGRGPSSSSRTGREPRKGLFDLRGLFEFERPKS